MPPAKQAFDTMICPYDRAAIDEAAALILTGYPVAVPTETVYGLAADATNGAAVAAIYAAKGRPSFNPLIVHVADLAAAERIAIFDDSARELAAKYWPGPLTLVLPLRDDSGITSLVTAGLSTIAVRVPAHPAMRALMAAVAQPLAAPSANASGTISPTRAAHVAASLGGRIAMIIDGGACAIGLESTIIACERSGLRLLRHGPIDVGLIVEHSDKIEAPGQLASHYAPAKALRLNADAARSGEWLIGFGAISGDRSLSPSGDMEEAAARLFDLLHEADKTPSRSIGVAPVPMVGLGIAINDRLSRAAT
jgi:L-threonylcarbamoyladenylate synthase